MTDTTVTVEHEDEEPPNEPTGESSDAVEDSTTVQAATEVAENKAHAEHAAQDSADAADAAGASAEVAQDAAETSTSAVGAVAGLTQSILDAVEAIPSKVAEALENVFVSRETSDSTPMLDEEPTSPEPVTPPQKTHWLERRIGGRK